MDNYFEQQDVTNEIDNWKNLNPFEDVENVKRGVLPSMWDHENSNRMEKLLEDFYTLLVWDNYNTTEEVSPKNNMVPINYYE